MQVGILFFVTVLVVVDLFAFAAIYQSLDNDWFVQREPDRRNITFIEALWSSVNFITLLGSGTVNPASDTASTWAGIQTFATFFAIVVIIGSKTLSASDE